MLCGTEEQHGRALAHLQLGAYMDDKKIVLPNLYLPDLATKTQE